MNQTPPARDKRDEEPPPGEVALVQCNGYRCMAYRDRDGKWRNYFRREELHGLVEVLEMFSC